MDVPSVYEGANIFIFSNVTIIIYVYIKEKIITYITRQLLVGKRQLRNSESFDFFNK